MAARISKTRLNWVKHQTADGTVYYRDASKNLTQWETPADFSGENHGIEIKDSEEPEEEHCTEFSEFTLEDGLNFEIQSLGLFAKYTKAPRLLSKAVQEEMLSKVTFVKDQLEGGVGADEDWTLALSTNDFALVEYLLRVLDERVPPSLSKAAAQCLAVAGTVYQKLWADFICDTDRLHDVLSMSIFLVKNISALAITKKMVKSASVPYIGFDERDVADYNLEGIEREEESGAEQDEEVQNSLLVLLMLLTQIYAQDVSVLKASFGTSASSAEGVEAVSRMTSDEILKALAAAQCEEQISTSRTMKLTCASLLLLMPSFSEDAYLLALKTISGLNRQSPKLDYLNSTEICKLCCLQQFDTHSQINVSEVSSELGVHAPYEHISATSNLSFSFCRASLTLTNSPQGVLHLLNDIGHPAHEVPEAIPVLRFCRDLVDLADAEGFFYSNDFKVIIDVILRELYNLPFTSETEASAFYQEELRVSYIKFAAALIAHDAWQSYKSSEMCDALQFVVSGTQSCSDWDSETLCWSRETAEEVLNIVQNL